VSISSQKEIPKLSPADTHLIYSGKKQPQNKLVIGKLTVQIIKEPKSKKPPTQYPILENKAEARQPALSPDRNSSIKVQFGLGQL